MLPYQSHVPHAPSRLNPSFPSSSFQIPSPLPSANSPASVPQPFPSPPIIIGGGRFGKRKVSIAQTQGMGRGTMSMPTSPVGQSINTEVWQGPHSASAYSSQPPENINVNVRPTQIPSFFSDQTISPPDPDYVNYAHRDHDHNNEGQDGEDVPPPRKKRAQVRVACTHCQKACKKCSNTRPCERCVKYGLPDCIDSMRKARKTGVKRGPYKRRTSSLYQEQYPLQPHHQHQPHSRHQPQQDQPYFNRSNPDQLPDPITQAFAAAFDKPTWINGRRQSINQIQYGYAAPPPPNSFQNNLIHTNSNSFPSLQDHGQRQRIPSISTTHIQTNTTEERRGSMSSIFPVSLHTFAGQDPFSRTVSPIGYKFSLPLPSSDVQNTTGMDIDQEPTTTGVEMDGINNDYSMSSITPPEINVVDFAYSTPVNQDRDQGTQSQVQGDGQGMVYHSAPTSPRGTRMDTEMDLGASIGRASSAEPSTSFTPLNPFQNQHLNQTRSPGMGLGMGGMGMMTPIPLPTLGDRKPSLLTLMNTPLAQPIHGAHGQESPTLFDGPPPISNHHQLDNTDKERKTSYFGSMQMSSLPNAGGVGRLSLSKGSEGLGLGLGLEHVS